MNSLISMGVPFDSAQGTPFIGFIAFLSEPYCDPPRFALKDFFVYFIRVSGF
jgi:hypothetical protein